MKAILLHLLDLIYFATETMSLPSSTRGREALLPIFEVDSCPPAGIDGILVTESGKVKVRVARGYGDRAALM